jgi:hypothetical protein
MYHFKTKPQNIAKIFRKFIEEICYTRNIGQARNTFEWPSTCQYLHLRWNLYKCINEFELIDNCFT